MPVQKSQEFTVNLTVQNNEVCEEPTLDGKLKGMQKTLMIEIDDT